MKLRTYQPGDEAAQAEIYNTAAAALPKFKPATAEEVLRRCTAADFDPATRIYAEEGDRIVGYATFQPNGRVSYPWCLGRYTAARDDLFEQVLQAMRQRGIKTAFVAYRGDWAEPLEYFRRRGFQQVREMVNFALPLIDMPTRAGHVNALSPMRREDVPAVYALAPNALRVGSAEELDKVLFQNPYFPASSCFVLRSRKDLALKGAAVLVVNKAYAEPTQVDPFMPCFRLGAFGTEGLSHKRINGLFSFIAAPDSECIRHAVAMLEFAGEKLEDAGLDTFGAQVPSDVPHLLRFYKEQFQRQGAFPILEKPVG
jgi:hypothetical protein